MQVHIVISDTNGPGPSLFAYHVGAPILADPDLVESLPLDINPLANPVSPLHGPLVLGKRDGQLAVEDQVRGEAVVRVRVVVGVPTFVVMPVSLPSCGGPRAEMSLVPPWWREPKPSSAGHGGVVDIDRCLAEAMEVGLRGISEETTFCRGMGKRLTAGLST